MEIIVFGILKVVWVIFIGWSILWFGSLGLYYSGHPRLTRLILSVLYFRETLKVKATEREGDVIKNGTDDERVEIYNKRDASYQFLTDAEVREKYKGLDFGKVEILFYPSFLYNIDTKKINDHIDESYFLDDNGEIKINLVPPSILEGNRYVSATTYKISNEELEGKMNELNGYDKIVIIRNKNEHYRYKILDNVI